MEKETYIVEATHLRINCTFTRPNFHNSMTEIIIFKNLRHQT